ncbi:MAG: hypothetical protein ACI97A_002289 [Planctomycetota bacterium]|jgi:hypothetical protein
MSIELVTELCRDHLDSQALANLNNMREKCGQGGWAYLEVHFASLPRKLGRGFIDVPQDQITSGIRLGSLRTCDLGAASLLLEIESAGTEARLFDLYAQGDALERCMILKALSFLPHDDNTIRLLQEAHRTNDEELFRAAFADTDLPSQVLSDDDYYRGVLKSAFMDIEYARLLDAPSRATSELSDMLLEFRSEREAAGRKPWPGSLELAAHAPSPAVPGCLAGDIRHGDDQRRFHAVRGAGLLIAKGHDFLREQLTIQQPKERNAQIKTEIERILA